MKSNLALILILYLIYALSPTLANNHVYANSKSCLDHLNSSPRLTKVEAISKKITSDFEITTSLNFDQILDFYSFLTVLIPKLQSSSFGELKVTQPMTRDHYQPVYNPKFKSFAIFVRQDTSYSEKTDNVSLRQIKTYQLDFQIHDLLDSVWNGGHLIQLENVVKITMGYHGPFKHSQKFFVPLAHEVLTDLKKSKVRIGFDLFWKGQKIGFISFDIQRQVENLKPNSSFEIEIFEPKLSLLDFSELEGNIQKLIEFCLSSEKEWNTQKL